MLDDSLIKKIDDLISTIFGEVLSTGKKEEELESQAPQTIEEYTKLTGKRFRMTKNQKECGQSRQEAFEEFINKNWRE